MLNTTLIFSNKKHDLKKTNMKKIIELHVVDTL